MLFLGMKPPALGAEFKLPPDVTADGEAVTLAGEDASVEGLDVRVEGESEPEIGESPVTPLVSEEPDKGAASDPDVPNEDPPPSAPPVEPVVPVSPVDGDDWMESVAVPEKLARAVSDVGGVAAPPAVPFEPAVEVAPPAPPLAAPKSCASPHEAHASAKKTMAWAWKSFFT
jgi:hypothetical protein